MIFWAVIDAKLTERAIHFLERTGVVKIAVIGLVAVVLLLIAGETRAERAHKAHVKADEDRATVVTSIAEAVKTLAEDRIEEKRYRKLFLNIWLDMCISANESADRSRRTCQDIAAGRLRYVE